ncbi:MAG: mechanosensitive ion channel family protein [Candidatus Aenigmatarchaeota archaeon]
MDLVAYLEPYLPGTMKILQTLLTIAVAFLVNKLIFHGLLNHFAKKAGIEEHYVKPIKHVFSILVYVSAFFVILYIFGVHGSLTGLLTGAGIAGIVIGMATKDVLSGAISGLILFLTRPFKIGDWVEIDGTEGIVEDLTLQWTEISTFEGEAVSLPNQLVATNQITNRTESPESRMDLGIGVDYDTDMEKAIEVCQEIIEEEENALKDKPQQVLVKEFGDSSINLILRFWIDRKNLQKKGINLPQIKSDLRNRIIEEFGKNGIEIPFPHMEIIKKD